VPICGRTHLKKLFQLVQDQHVGVEEHHTVESLVRKMLQQEWLGRDERSPSPSAQWLRGSRFVAVTAYLYNSRRNRVDRLAFTFLDTTDHTFALFDVSLEAAGRRLVEVGDEWIIPGRPSAGDGAEIRISPGELTWKRWGTLRS
jgi:hypothetical protein